jgi:hypothetical protein
MRGWPAPTMALATLPPRAPFGHPWSHRSAEMTGQGSTPPHGGTRGFFTKLREF